MRCFGLSTPARTGLFCSIQRKREQTDFAKSVDWRIRYYSRPFTHSSHLTILTKPAFIFSFKVSSLTLILGVFGRFEFTTFFHPISPFPRGICNFLLIYFFARFVIIDKLDKWFLEPLECFALLLGRIISLCS